MQYLVLLLSLIFAANAVTELEYRNVFTSFIHEHSKSYSAVELATRFEAFKNNYDFVQNWSDPQFQVGINAFADLTNQEFAAMYNGLRIPEGYVHEQTFFPKLTALPDAKNWADLGAVTKVKDQGQCGSCWSFSTTGSVEGCHFITAGSLVGLSEKNLMDCSWKQGNQGCNGGLMTAAMDYIIANGGIDSESSYPYQPVDSKTCGYKAASKSSSLKSYANVKANSEADLQTAVNNGPVSVAIDASHSSFQLYKSGVYYEKSCSSSALDHGVLAVGWGTSSGSDYWIVKNSWGTSWGLNGYIWMSRNRSNNCGIATMATLPAGCAN